MAAENERPCGQPSVSTCVLLCLFASLPLYLCACSNVCLCNCVLARLQVQVLGQQCALVYFCSCLHAILGQPSVSTCVLLRLFICVPLYLCASLHVCLCTCVLVYMCASVLVCLRNCKCKYYVNCAHLCTCVLVYLRALGQPSVNTCVHVRLFASVLVYMFASVIVCLRACVHASASTWSTVRTCVLVFSFTCEYLVKRE